MSILLKKPDTCQNLNCNEKLLDFDIKAKRRFCRKCRISGLIEWKCIDCNRTISNSQCRETRKRCNYCQGMIKDDGC